MEFKAMLFTAADISRLSPQERLNLIEQLWDSLDPESVPVTSAQKAELDLRLETFEQEKMKGIPWEYLKAKLARRCP
jgi:putative addiction module component (TIGR02574 family)